MKTAAIAIDRYKLPTFKRHLEAGGYEIVEETDGVTPETMFLKVPYPHGGAADLAKVCRAATDECKRSKAN